MKSHMEMNSNIERSEVRRDRGDVKRPSNELPHMKSMEGRRLERTRESERPSTELPHIKEKNIQKQNNKEINEVPKLGGSYSDVKNLAMEKRMKFTICRQTVHHILNVMMVLQ